MATNTTTTYAPKRISKQQTADRLGATLPVVKRLIANGELKEIPLPGARFTIVEASVDALVARMVDNSRQVG